MMTRALACCAVLGGLALTACVDELPLPSQAPPSSTAVAPGSDAASLSKPAAPATPPPATCATPTAVERWTGSASRTSGMYPDDIAATLTWQRVAASGCVDRYVPTGEADYSFAIPGALCTQTIAPATLAVAGAHGLLTIDRSTSPATYTVSGEASWQVTWTCAFDDGSHDEMTFAAGGVWLRGGGEVDGTSIDGTWVQPDGTQCGRGDSTTGCTYEWSFTAAP